MTDENQYITPLSDLGDVVEAWNDLVLFADANGTVSAVEGTPLDYIPDSGATGIPFWKALTLKADSLQQALKRFPSGHIHEISCCKGRSFLLRIIPVSRHIAPQGGFVVVATDNRPMEEFYETYEERLEDNITAWSDSITLFNALFDTAKDATFLIDENGVILTVNPAGKEQHGSPDASLVGEDFIPLFAKRSQGPAREAMRTLRSREVWTRTVAAVDGQGDIFPAEATLRRIQFSDYGLFQLILHDLSTHEELKEDLRHKKAEVEKMNIALKQVIKSVEEERQELRENLSNQVKKQMLPALDRIAKENVPEIREGYRTVIEDQLADLTGSNGTETDAALLRLSPRELEVCQLIQLGRSGKEIAELLSMSFETVQTHRKNIRKKLGLRGKNTSLFAYLRQKPSLS